MSKNPSELILPQTSFCWTFEIKVAQFSVKHLFFGIPSEMKPHLWPAPRACFRRLSLTSHSRLNLRKNSSFSNLLLWSGTTRGIFTDSWRPLEPLPWRVRKSSPARAQPFLFFSPPSLTPGSSASVCFFFVFGWVSLPTDCSVARCAQLPASVPALRLTHWWSACCALWAASGSKWFSLSDPLRSMRITLTVYTPLLPLLLPCLNRSSCLSIISNKRPGVSPARLFLCVK